MTKTCPFHEGPITAPCQLTKCDLWVDGHATKCALVAIQEEPDRWREDPELFVCGLLGLTLERAKELSQLGYEALRMTALREDCVPQFVLKPSNGHCVVCRRRSRLFKEGWGWCSQTCYRWKPLQAVKLEQQWGEDFRTLLKLWRNMRVRTLTEMTGIDYQTLRWLIWQHTGWTKDQPSGQWRVRDESLVPPPELPSKKLLLKRLRRSACWQDEAQPS